MQLISQSASPLRRIHINSCATEYLQAAMNDAYNTNAQCTRDFSIFFLSIFAKFKHCKSVHVLCSIERLQLYNEWRKIKYLQSRKGERKRERRSEGKRQRRWRKKPANEEKKVQKWQENFKFRIASKNSFYFNLACVSNTVHRKLYL